MRLCEGCGIIIGTGLVYKVLTFHHGVNKMISIIITILVGAFVGWLAGLLMKSKHGFWVNCLLGILGAFLGGAIASVLHISGGVIVSLIIQVLGTCLVIAIARLIMGKKF